MKANNIPITHDETATTVHYYNFTVWEIMMYPDQWPNNHILNTIITKLFINIGGKFQLAVRLPNVLFFIIYCTGVYRILKTLKGEKYILFFTGATLFFANAYLLDFFSLCRGYGISIALVTLSISFLLTGFFRKRKAHIWGAFFLAILASYANFTALVFWVAISSFSIMYFLFIGDKSSRLKSVFQLILFSVSYLALIYVPIKKMTTSNQFEYWTSNGFYNDTIFSLVENWKYGIALPFGISAKTISASILILFVLNLGLVIRKLYTSKATSKIITTPYIFLFSLLSFTALVSIAQSWILGTPNLSGRTALFFYPLFAAWVISVIMKISTQIDNWGKVIFAIIMPCLLWLHFYHAHNPKNVREWWYDENTFEVLDYLKDQHTSESVSLSVNWHFHRSFFFYAETGKTPWLDLAPYAKDLAYSDAQEYVYVMESDLVLFDKDFIRIQKFGWDRWLLKKVN